MRYPILLSFLFYLIHLTSQAKLPLPPIVHAFEAYNTFYGFQISREKINTNPDGSISNIVYANFSQYNTSQTGNQSSIYCWSISHINQNDLELVVNGDTNRVKKYQIVYNGNTPIFISSNSDRYIINYNDQQQITEFMKEGWANVSTNPIKKSAKLEYDSKGRISKITYFTIYGKGKVPEEINRVVTKVTEHSYLESPTNFTVNSQYSESVLNSKKEIIGTNSHKETVKLDKDGENNYTITYSNDMYDQLAVQVDQYINNKITHSEYTAPNYKRMIEFVTDANGDIIKTTFNEYENNVLKEKKITSYTYKIEKVFIYNEEKLDKVSYFEQDIYDTNNELIEQRNSKQGMRTKQNGVWGEWYRPGCGVR